jgi:hypothetical protein
VPERWVKEKSPPLRAGSIRYVNGYFSRLCGPAQRRSWRPGWLALRIPSRPSSKPFRSLNRCLDEAIADAVTAFADVHETALLDRSADLHQRLGKLAEEQGRLVAIALQTFAAIQSGNC